MATTSDMNNRGLTTNKNEMESVGSTLTQPDLLYTRAYDDAMEDYWLHGKQPQRPSYLPEEIQNHVHKEIQDGVDKEIPIKRYSMFKCFEH